MCVVSHTQSSGSTNHSHVRKSDQRPARDQLQVHTFAAVCLHYVLLLSLGMATKTTARPECSQGGAGHFQPSRHPISFTMSKFIVL